MPYGVLTDEMQALMKPLVKGKVVYDLGSWDLGRARQIARMGAKKVVCVDKDFVDTRRAGKKLQIQVMTFFDLFESLPEDFEIEVAFLGWPVNWYLPGLLEVLGISSVVCYLGQNDETTMCGWPGMFEHLRTREVLGHVEHPLNTMICYGPEPRKDDLLVPEEARALKQVAMWSPRALSEVLLDLV